MTRHQPSPDQLAQIKKQIRVYQALTLLLAAAVLALLALAYHAYGAHLRSALHLIPESGRNLPFYDEITRILEPLEYSAFPELTRPDVSLSVDFENRRWTLHKLHEFDADGNVILNHGRSGICAELAGYTYRRIKELMKDRAEIKFVRAAESGFFLSPFSTHVILLVYDKVTRNTYLIDPSFHRYGRESDFDEYLYFNIEDNLSFIQNRETDVYFEADHGTPLLIRNDYLIYFSVEGINGKFDRDNFALGITANRRYKFTGRYLYALRRSNGVEQKHENKWLQEEILTPEEYKVLSDKISAWFSQISSSR